MDVNTDNFTKDSQEGFIYSWRFSDELAQSKYQIEVKTTKWSDGTVTRLYSENDNIIDFFIWLRKWSEGFEGEEFLEYQFNSYNGNKIKWLKITERIIKSDLSALDERLNFYKIIYEEALKWISDKQKLIDEKENIVIEAAGLETLFIKEPPQVLLPFLKKEYTNKKPKPITIMLYALHTLELIEHPSNHPNKTELHRLLEATFGNIGTRQAYDEQIDNLQSPSSYEVNKIKSVCKRIKENCEVKTAKK